MKKTFEYKYELGTLVETKNGLISNVESIGYIYDGFVDSVTYRLTDAINYYYENEIKPYNPNKQDFKILEEVNVYIDGKKKNVLHVEKDNISYWYEKSEFNKIFE